MTLLDFITTLEANQPIKIYEAKGKKQLKIQSTVTRVRRQLKKKYYSFEYDDILKVRISDGYLEIQIDSDFKDHYYQDESKDFK